MAASIERQKGGREYGAQAWEGISISSTRTLGVPDLTSCEYRNPQNLYSLRNTGNTTAIGSPGTDCVPIDIPVGTVLLFQNVTDGTQRKEYYSLQLYPIYNNRNENVN